jgi:hypothetical protein
LMSAWTNSHEFTKMHGFHMCYIFIFIMEWFGRGALTQR